MVTVDVRHTGQSGGVVSLVERIQKLRKKRIMVGIPEQKTARKDEEINNAQLLYILSHGVRKKSMRDEMQPNIDAGMKYSAAYQLYIMSHGSPAGVGAGYRGAQGCDSEAVFGRSESGLQRRRVRC